LIRIEMWSIYLLIMLLFFSPVTGPNIAADEQSSETPVYIMDEIVVSHKVQLSASEIILDDEQIQTQRSGSVADILAGVPGASVTVGNKNSSEIMIRGFTSRDVLVMVDGRPVNEPYYGTIDLSTIGIGNITRIKVEKGSSSVRYGPNAMGGVVNIMTGSADEKTPINLRFTAGSGKEIRADLIHNGKINKIKYRIHFGQNVTDGFPLSSGFEPTSLENGNLRNNSDSRRTDVGAKLLFGSDKDTRWSLSLGNSRMEKGLPSAIYEPRFWRFRKWNRTSIDIDGEPVKGKTFTVKTKLYAERFLNELVDYRDEQYDPANVYWVSTHDNRSAGLLVSSSYISGENKITNFGFQVRWEESNRQQDRGLEWFENRTVTNWVFVEHIRQYTPRLFLRGGLSGHLFSYDSWKRSSMSVNPSLHLDWKVREFTIIGAASRVSRFPTLHQLFSETSGNPDLEPEWAYKGEITVSRHLFDVANLSVAGFMNRVHDMIYRSGRLGIYHNVEKASLDGVEISGTFVLPEFEIFSTLTLLDAHDGNGEKLEYRPSWKVDTGLNCKITGDIRFHLTSRVVGRRWSELNTYLNSYHAEDIGIFLWESRSISSSISLKNIFDVNYEEEYGFPMAGRTVWLGMDWRWSKT